jgi:nucleotide-binding universal stress UspA family protein
MTVSINDVLVPLDGSRFAERAIGFAAEVADRTGSSLTLISCAPDDEAAARATYLEGRARDFVRRPDVGTVVSSDGSAADAINERSGPGTLVCMSSHGRGRSAALLGSVAESVLRAIRSPILLVGPRVPAHAWLGAGRIVACIDGTAEAAAVLDPAAAFATALGMPLWLTEVISPEAAAEQEGLDVMETGSLVFAARRLGPVVVGWDILHDPNAARALVEHAQTGPVSMLVLAAHAATGWHRLTAGSVTATVVHGAPVPVLVVPAGLDRIGGRPLRAASVVSAK